MERHGVTFRKDYGQNFLTNPMIPSDIADACADTARTGILEIGPGIGTMTRELCARYDRVRCVEIDDRLIPVLAETLADFDNVRVIHADFMKLDLPKFLEEEFGDMPVSVCANLPYYITTPILMKLIEEASERLDSITVMVQAEVAARLVAAPGKGDYGAITSVLAYYGTVKRLFTVSAGSFVPAPKVNSAVVRMDLHREKPVKPRDEKLFFSVIAGAFEQRRKTLANALSSALPQYSKETIAAAIADCALAPDIRGERLSVAQFAALSDRLCQGE